MDVTVLHIEDCPNASALVNRLCEVLADTSASITARTVKSMTEAAELRMHGSPTVLVDGRDPFVDAPEASMSCRLYATEDGLRGLPSVPQLRSAVTELAAVEILTEPGHPDPEGRV